MSKQTMPSASANTSKRKITIERTYKAAPQKVWDLWTTKEGIESWWGPDGFTVKVRKLELRPGGELQYAMTAIAPAKVEFMKQAGMPLTTEARATYGEIAVSQRLAYTHRADFIPGVEPYDIATVVEFHPKGQSVRMVLSFDAMHDEEWTQRAVMGWESELGKLEKTIGERRVGAVQ